MGHTEKRDRIKQLVGNETNKEKQKARINERAKKFAADIKEAGSLIPSPQPFLDELERNRKELIDEIDRGA